MINIAIFNQTASKVNQIQQHTALNLKIAYVVEIRD
jgi:hypothetical protein